MASKFAMFTLGYCPIWQRLQDISWFSRRTPCFSANIHWRVLTQGYSRATAEARAQSSDGRIQMAAVDTARVPTLVELPSQIRDCVMISTAFRRRPSGAAGPLDTTTKPRACPGQTPGPQHNGARAAAFCFLGRMPLLYCTGRPPNWWPTAFARHHRRQRVCHHDTWTARRILSTVG